VAAYSVATRIDSFATMPAMAFSAALSTFVGQNIGANKYDRIGKGLNATLIMISLVAITISASTVIFAEPLMRLFTNKEDVEVVAIGVDYLRIVSPFYLVFSLMFIFNGVLRGAGDTVFPMFITLLALWVIRLPISYWLSLKMDAIGIWWGIPIAWGFGVMASFLYYKTGKWKKKAVVKHDQSPK
jgi:Na+-driven multidrug efflux pump